MKPGEPPSSFDAINHLTHVTDHLDSFAVAFEFNWISNDIGIIIVLAFIDRGEKDRHS